MERYTYDVFGRPTIRDANGTEIEDSACGNPYLFTGRAWDPETALYYCRARYYDYATARFLQPDPIGYGDGLNLYSYVANNPMSWTDPYGLCKGGWLDWAQGALDFVGTFDPTGLSDAVNALIYLGRGQFGYAAISGLAIIPYVGDLGKAGKYGAKALKAADEINDARRAFNRIDNVTDAARTADKFLDDATRFLGEGYEEIAPGVFRSKDGLRQVRFTDADVAGIHGGRNVGSHGHFETIDPVTGKPTKNIHIPLQE